MLALLLVLGLCACGESEKASQKEGLQIGFGRADATPFEAVNISGGDSKNRMSTGYRDPIMVTCLAISTGGDTFLVYTMDYITASSDYTAEAETLITEATGVPADKIIMNCTHTHSGPAIGYDYETITPYREKFNKAAVKAAKEAVEDMDSARIYSGAVQTEGLIFVRHYAMSDGTFAGANYGSFSSSIEGHAYEGDAQVQVVKFAREAADKKDIILVSNPAHATAVSGTDRDMLSADIAFSVRDYVEKNTDAHVAYFIGAAGDQVPSSRIPAEGSTNDYLIYGERMGKYVVELLPGLTPLDSGNAVLKTQKFTGNTIKEGLERLQDAQQVHPTIKKFGNSAPETKAAVAQYGFSSPYQVTAIINRSKMAETRTMTLNTLALGDMAFVFAPYEMFSENGKFIKENSPYPMTFVVTCSENHQGYLPSVNGFRVECYETHVTNYARGTAEDLANTYIEMLTAMKNGQ